MNTAPVAGLLEEMVSANEMLEEITSGVNQYLEKKRLYVFFSDFKLSAFIVFQQNMSVGTFQDFSFFPMTKCWKFCLKPKTP